MALNIVVFLANFDPESLDLLFSKDKQNVSIHINLLDFAVHYLLL